MNMVVPEHGRSASDWVPSLRDLIRVLPFTGHLRAGLSCAAASLKI
jgi:hypothetical protein